MRFGPYDVSVVTDGSYRLDGGSMFGVVPKILWERIHPADEHNRIELALRCLLVRGEGHVVLVDCGMGDGWGERERRIYDIRRDGGGLLADLQRQGVAPQDVTDVVLTHLHFDHAGGAVTREGGAPRPTFPRATHWVQGQNLEWARQPTERDRRSFRSVDWETLLEHEGQLRLLQGPREILPGLTVMVVNGHTPGQQLARIGDRDATLLFCADLIPFASQLRVPWTMAFDLNPLLTLTEKKQILAQANAEGWVLAFDHDPRVQACTIEYRDDGFVLREEVQL